MLGVSGREKAIGAILVLTALAAGGCVGTAPAAATPPSATPSPVPSFTSSVVPSASASPSALPSDSPSAEPSPAATVAPQPSLEEVATPTPTPPATDPLPVVASAPAGPWKGIDWVALPDSAEYGWQKLPERSTFQVFGWSRGYVSFTMTPNEVPADQLDQIMYVDPTVTSGWSSDGVHWHAGQKLIPSEAGSHGDFQVIRSIIDGPGGLLAVGWTGGCASEYLDALWTSSDGKVWRPVNVQTVFGKDGPTIASVSGGAAGYTAVATHNLGTWTSPDGRNWKRVDQNQAPFSNALVDDATAGSGGFVLAGTTGAHDCATMVYDDEHTPPPPVARTPSAWWSADGAAWTKVALPGAVSSTDAGSSWASRLSDRAVIIVNGRKVWGSRDCQTWTSIAFPADIEPRYIIASGQRNLVVQAVGVGVDEYPEDPAQLRIRTIDDAFAVSLLTQSGAVPKILLNTPDGYPYGLVALGPTGIVATSPDGSALWFGRVHG